MSIYNIWVHLKIITRPLSAWFRASEPKITVHLHLFSASTCPFSKNPVSPYALLSLFDYTLRNPFLSLILLFSASTCSSYFPQCPTHVHVPIDYCLYSGGLNKRSTTWRITETTVLTFDAGLLAIIDSEETVLSLKATSIHILLALPRGRIVPIPKEGCPTLRSVLWSWTVCATDSSYNHRTSKNTVTERQGTKWTVPKRQVPAAATSISCFLVWHPLAFNRHLLL